MRKHKYSIITACKNAEKSIGKTISSIINQANINNIECIVVDGESDDKTLHVANNILKTNTIKYKIYSKKDKSVFEAMNVGIKLAQGDIITFLNAGDCFHSSKVIDYVDKSFNLNNLDFVYGNILEIHNNGNSNSIFRANPNNSFYFLNNFIPHPSSFVKKQVFDECGNFNEKYKIIADHEWFMRVVLKYKKKFGHINKILVDYRMGGLSSSKNVNLINLREAEKDIVNMNYYPNNIKKYFLLRKIAGYKVSNILLDILGYKLYNFKGEIKC